MKKNHLAALLGSVLFMAGFALATGVDENMAQAVACLIMLAASAACFRYADKSAGSKQTIEARKTAAQKREVAA